MGAGSRSACVERPRRDFRSRARQQRLVLYGISSWCAFCRPGVQGNRRVVAHRAGIRARDHTLHRRGPRGVDGVTDSGVGRFFAVRRVRSLTKSQNKIALQTPLSREEEERNAREARRAFSASSSAFVDTPKGLRKKSTSFLGYARRVRTTQATASGARFEALEPHVAPEPRERVLRKRNASLLVCNTHTHTFFFSFFP